VEMTLRSLLVVVRPILARMVAYKEIYDKEGFQWPTLVNFRMQVVRQEATSSVVVLHQHSGGEPLPKKHYDCG